MQSELEVARSLYEKGKFPSAESILRSTAKSEPSNVAALVILAFLCLKTGRSDEAAELLESAIEIEHEQYESLATLAMIRQSKGDPKGAIQLATRAVSANPTGADGHDALGVALLADGRAGEAVEELWKAVSINQKSAPARHNLGVALRAMDRGRDAYEQFRIAIQLAPQDPANYQDLYRQIRWLSNWREGLPYLELTRQFHPGNLDLAELLADAYGRSGESDHADQLFREVLERDPSRSQLFVAWLKDSGRFEEATELLTSVLNHDWAQGWPYYELAEAKVYEVGGQPLAERISRVMSEAELSPESQMLLTHALALCQENDGDYEKAMKTYIEANNLAHSLYAPIRFDEASEVEKFHRSRALFNHDSIQGLRSHGSTSETPIFVVGMIRSGTTLINQILSSHSSVASAGELPYWRSASALTKSRWSNLGVVPDDLQPLANEYLRELDMVVAHPSPRIVDKMPLNFLHLGLIYAAFPRAKIIHMRRSPVDTCLSIFTTNLGEGASFAFRREDIAAFYRIYQNAMEYWRSVLPADNLIEVDYEELVANSESVTRNVLTFCALPWEAACLSPESNSSTLTTPSYWQARQPIYQTSVERWRRFEPWLGLFKLL